MKTKNTSLNVVTDRELQNSEYPVNKILNLFFENSIIPQLLVDSELFLKDFTPAAGKLFSLNKEDINKSICGIKDKFNHKSFIENIRGVFITERELKKEVQTLDQSRYLMCIQPWFSEKEEAVSGALITFSEMGIPFSLIKELEDLKTENNELKELLLRELRKSRQSR